MANPPSGIGSTWFVAENDPPMANPPSGIGSTWFVAENDPPMANPPWGNEFGMDPGRPTPLVPEAEFSGNFVHIFKPENLA